VKKADPQQWRVAFVDTTGSADQSYFARHGISAPLVVRLTNSLRPEFTATPETMILDKQGRVEIAYSGALSAERFDEFDGAISATHKLNGDPTR
jgi:hypothetical protein